MTQNGRISSIEHPQILGSSRAWLRLLAHSGGIDREFLPRAVFVTLSTVFTSPLRAYERLQYDSVLRRTQVDPSPIFIIGHWRTGTTFLHHLLCQDPSLGYVSTFQAFAPDLCLIGERTFKRPLAWMARRRHPTREVDNVPLVFDDPQEDELAIASLSPHSFLHWYTFPRRGPHFFESYALFDHLSDSAADEWRRSYLEVLRKATLRSGGKQLVLKNCSNTGRIEAILDLFPEARFIHIYRNPYDVFRSTRHLSVTVVRRSQLQEVCVGEIEALILSFYERLLRRFLADRPLIPPGHLVELSFEDLEEQPLDQIRRVYDKLGLLGFTHAEPRLRSYLDSVAGYEKNEYDLDGDVVAKVNEHWGFAFDEWGYQRLEPSSTNHSKPLGS
jgi:hypothetical protein